MGWKKKDGNVFWEFGGGDNGESYVPHKQAIGGVKQSEQLKNNKNLILYLYNTLLSPQDT